MSKTTTRAVVTTAMIDELAQVRDQLRALTAREKLLKEALRADCAGVDTVYKGRAYQLEVKFTQELRLDTAAARATLGEEWCKDHMNAVEKMNIRQMEIL
jgi:hypothetical protein